jgi:hypothetical protein
MFCVVAAVLVRTCGEIKNWQFETGERKWEAGVASITSLELSRGNKSRRSVETTMMSSYSIPWLMLGEQSPRSNSFESSLARMSSCKFPFPPSSLNNLRTHDWGYELEQDNHAKVGLVNKLLKARGLSTWFDEEKMEVITTPPSSLPHPSHHSLKGNIKKQMASGIDNAQCVVVFITRRYVDKVGGTNPEDNCQLEFNYAARRKGANRMIGVVMESRMADASSWAGEVGLVLGGRLYADMTGDFNDSAYLERCADDLYNRIMKVIGKPVPSFNIQIHSNIHPSTTASASASSSSPTGMDRDSLLSSAAHPHSNTNNSSSQSKQDTKPLSSLSVEEVSMLLHSLRLGKFVDQLRENEVDGATLALCKSEEEIVEVGVSMQLKARVLLAKIQVYRVEGVPLTDLVAPVVVAKQKEREKEREKKVFPEREVEAIAAVAQPQQQQQPRQSQQDSSSGVGHCGRESIGISGATGPCDLLNGIYELTTESYGGMPRFKKQNEDHWLEYNSDQGRWHCKPGAKKGTLEAWAYLSCEPRLPYELSGTSGAGGGTKNSSSSNSWHVFDGSSFHPQSLICYSAASFSVFGCVLSVLDGVYDPCPSAEEMHGNTCRYHRRDGSDYWFEYSSTQQQWHITRAADKGTHQAFAYAISPSCLPPWKQPQGQLCWKTFNGTTKAFDDNPDLLILPEPRPLQVSGGSGPTAQYIAGIYDPCVATTGTRKREGEAPLELYGGWVRYRKRTDPDSWVEYLASQKQWHIKPTSSKTQTNVQCTSLPPLLSSPLLSPLPLPLPFPADLSSLSLRPLHVAGLGDGVVASAGSLSGHRTLVSLQQLCFHS